jgi:hypothetical protein
VEEQILDSWTERRSKEWQKLSRQQMVAKCISRNMGKRSPRKEDDFLLLLTNTFRTCCDKGDLGLYKS